MGRKIIMNLRKARIDDHWRRLFNRNYDIYINNITLEGEHIFTELCPSFNKGVSCIVGKNGIGKSNFIRTIHNAFHTSDSNREMFNISIINEGLINFNILKNDANILMSVNIGDQLDQTEDDFITSFLFDPCNIIPTLQKMLISQDNFEEMLDGFNQQVLDLEEVKIINYLTNNNYEEIKLTIIEDEYRNFSCFPFFSVKINSIIYDVRTMGLGEFSLFYFYWLVNYIKKYEKAKILLIEEPESFLPPSSQERFVNVLAKMLSESGVSCILTTHSEHILKRIPRENIIIFQKENKKIKCRQANDNFEHLRVIGLTAPKLGILLFEDFAAFIFFKSLIKFSKEYVTDSFYFHISGSDGDIINDLKRMPSKLNSFRIIGIFDGDCRDHKFNFDKSSLYTFLPSNLPPEELLINSLKLLDESVLAVLFNKNIDEINFAIGETGGCDHHDYFDILSKMLDLDCEFIMSSVCNLWVNNPQNECVVIDFINDFKEKVE